MLHIFQRKQRKTKLETGCGKNPSSVGKNKKWCRRVPEKWHQERSAVCVSVLHTHGFPKQTKKHTIELHLLVNIEKYNLSLFVIFMINSHKRRKINWWLLLSVWKHKNVLQTLCITVNRSTKGPPPTVQVCEEDSVMFLPLFADKIASDVNRGHHCQQNLLKIVNHYICNKSVEWIHTSLKYILWYSVTYFGVNCCSYSF